jgi:hypothetical protein
MNTHLFLNSSSEPSTRSRWETPLTGALLTLALGLMALTAPAHGNTYQPATRSEATSVAAAAEASGERRDASSFSALADGIYLYGESSEPDQIGSAYMIFEVSDRQVIGAFYMPQSSFDCFHGEVKANELALNVHNSYDQESYPYSVAVNVQSSIATTGNPILTASLGGFQPVASISEVNHEVLDTCRASF